MLTHPSGAGRPGVPSDVKKQDRRKEDVMKHGARNTITATVKSIRKGDIMSLIKFEDISAVEMASVLTTESVEDMKLKVGNKVQLIIKAVHVLPVKA